MFLASLNLYRRLSRNRSRKIADKVGGHFPDGASILDFGCGNGWTAERILAVRPSVRITGIDVIRDQNLNDINVERLAFRLYDGSRIPFDDGHFDGVLAASVLHHTPNPEFFLDEFVRVTKRTGVVVIVEEMYENVMNRIWISWQDWVLNKLKKGVPVPLQFRAYEHYKREFATRGLRIVSESSVRPGFPWQLHRVFCLGKLLDLSIQTVEPLS